MKELTLILSKSLSGSESVHRDTASVGVRCDEAKVAASEKNADWEPQPPLSDMSETDVLSCGVPQGSLLGPFLFMFCPLVTQKKSGCNFFFPELSWPCCPLERTELHCWVSRGCHFFLKKEMFPVTSVQTVVSFIVPYLNLKSTKLFVHRWFQILKKTYWFCWGFGSHQEPLGLWYYWGSISLHHHLRHLKTQKKVSPFTEFWKNIKHYSLHQLQVNFCDLTFIFPFLIIMLCPFKKKHFVMFSVISAI